MSFKTHFSNPMANRDWTEEEVEKTIRVYFEMLKAELEGEPYVKAQHRRNLQSRLNDRSESAIGYKFQNISAALDDLGFPYIEGYKPAVNYQSLVKEKLVAHLDGEENLQALLRREGIDPDGIEELAQTVNRRAENYEIGDLQQIRKELQGLQRRSSSKIFSQQTIIEDYAYHHGGRTEPQFNLAYREYDGHLKIRHGLGISLQDSQWVDGVMEEMLPRIRYFNEYLSAHQDEFPGVKLWYEPKDSNVPREDLPPVPIPNSYVREENFIILGRRKRPSELSYGEILELFDRLLPLYVYIEENVNRKETDSDTGVPSTPQKTERKHETTAEPAQAEIDVQLRHNRMQDALESQFSEEHGTEYVEAEHPRGHGRVDLVVETVDSWDFYEIKPYSDPRLCIREAAGQLLEYAYWPGTEEPDRLVVVGESELDSKGERYLNRLRRKFDVPIDYESFSAGEVPS